MDFHRFRGPRFRRQTFAAEMMPLKKALLDSSWLLSSILDSSIHRIWRLGWLAGWLAGWAGWLAGWAGWLAGLAGFWLAADFSGWISEIS